MLGLSTLCYIEKDGKYLMLHRTIKEHDVNKDKWIGVGGHFEADESPEECLIREVKEETGYALTSWRYRGLVTFVSGNGVTEYMSLFTSDEFIGQEILCDEGNLVWIKKEDVFALNIWEGDKIFLKLLYERETFFSLKLVYDGADCLTYAALDGVPINCGIKGNERKNVRGILEKLDQVYGTSKEGFYHQELWQLLVAIMLSAQSTDKQVDEVLPALFRRFVTVNDMAVASEEEIGSYIRSIGLYKSKAKNLKKCCIQVEKQFKGLVPVKMEELLTLAGVGRKTATLFLADAFGIPGITVDTHVFRISKRLGWANGKNPQIVEKELERVLPKEHWNRINFQLIYHGREICKARKAKCGQCFLEPWCEKKEVERC